MRDFFISEREMMKGLQSFLYEEEVINTSSCKTASNQEEELDLNFSKTQFDGFQSCQLFQISHIYLTYKFSARRQTPSLAHQKRITTNLVDLIKGFRAYHTYPTHSP